MAVMKFFCVCLRLVMSATIWWQKDCHELWSFHYVDTSWCQVTGESFDDGLLLGLFART
jgi:hypothetical protein